MTWSYSRIRSFGDCPYRWYLRYLCGIHGADTFFASYGSFMHKLIELYYKEHKTPNQLYQMYLTGFTSSVKGQAPNQKVFENYFTSGISYLKNIEPFPYKPLAVEQFVSFTVGGIPFVGYIDFLGERDGALCIVDNKSRVLKPRSRRKTPTKADAELDEYLVQLYLYAAAVEQQYGKRPEYLCFNCFRENLLIEEPFSEKAYKAAREWAAGSVKQIERESDFKPDADFFKCTHLCEMRDACEYYDLIFGG